MALVDKIQNAWHFDQQQGTVAYDSSGDNPGTLSTEALWTAAGKVGGAISNNGSARSIALSSLTLPAVGALSAWVKTSNTGRQSIISTAADVVGLYWDLNYKPGTGGASTGYLGFAIENPTSNPLSFSAEIGADLYDGNWHHLVVTWAAGNADACAVYFDGEEQTVTAAFIGPVTTSQKNCVIGAGRNPSGGLQNYINGAIDSLILFDEVLTEAEVAELYNGGDGLQPYKPVGGYAAYTLVNGRLMRIG